MNHDQIPTNDQLMVQYLGAAVLLCWQDLPGKMQKLILDQANDAIGIVRAPMIRDQISQFLSRRSRSTPQRHDRQQSA